MPDFPTQPDVTSEEAVEYTPAVGEALGVSREEWDRQPRWKQLKMGALADQKREEARRADRAEAVAGEYREQLAALQAQVAQISARVDTKPEEKQGLAAYSEADLKDAKDKALQWMFRARNADDEEAQAQAAKIDPSFISQIDEELQRRLVTNAVGGLRGELDTQRQKEARMAKIKQDLVREYGNDVLDLNSDLMRAAAQELRGLLQDAGKKEDEDGLLSKWAVERAAHQLQQSRGGREMSETDRRRLAVEGQARREASTLNDIAALKQRGDWRSQNQATNLEIGEWLKANGYGQG